MAPVLFAGMIVDASCLAPCGSEVFTPASPTQREAKRETVEALENMSRQKEEGHGRLHHCVGVRQKKAEWKSFSLFITQCISITLFYFSSFIPPSLSLSSVLSHSSSLSTHKSKQKFPFTYCHTAWLPRQMGACSSHAHTQRGPLNIQVPTVAFIDI